MKKSMIFLTIAVIIILMIGAVPHFLSTMGKDVLISLIESKAHAKVNIESLHLSWFGPQKVNQVVYSNPFLQITVKSISLNVPFWKILTTEKLTKSILFSSVILDDGHLEFEHHHLPISFFDIQGKSNDGKIELSGKTQKQKIFGHFTIVTNRESAHLSFDAENFPTDILHLFAEQKNIDLPLIDIIGPVFNIHLLSEVNTLSGPIDCEFSSDNIKTSLHAFFRDDDVTLNKDLEISFMLTHGLTTLLKDVNPLFKTNLKSQTPISLKVKADNFSFPLSFELDKIHAIAVLDMGKLEAGINDYLQYIFEVLKSSSSHVATLWCTPVNITMENGVVHTGRMDVLINDLLHICSFGDIDLIQDKVHMTLGLTASLLNKAFGIKNLPSDYVILIPIRGPTSHVTIKADKAIAKITQLVATNSTVPTALLNNALGLIGKIIKDEEKAPPPEWPYPWKEE